MTRRMYPEGAPRVVGTAEACKALGVNRQRLHVLSKRDGFPPATELEIGRVWDRADLLAWNRERKKRTVRAKT